MSNLCRTNSAESEQAISEVRGPNPTDTGIHQGFREFGTTAADGE